MKIKILIALSLIALIVGYSCQEDLEVVDPMSQDVGKGRLSVSQLDAESAKSLYEIMNNIVELPSWAERKNVMIRIVSNMLILKLKFILTRAKMIVAYTIYMDVCIMIPQTSK